MDVELVNDMAAPHRRGGMMHETYVSPVGLGLHPLPPSPPSSHQRNLNIIIMISRSPYGPGFCVPVKYHDNLVTTIDEV